MKQYIKKTKKDFLKIINDRIKLVNITATTETIQLQDNRGIHELGFVGQPLFSIELPPSPDDAIELDFKPEGRKIPRLAPNGDDDTELLSWAEGTRGVDDLSCILRHLPTGDYMFIRSDRSPLKAQEVQMGNELVSAPPHICSLLQNEEQVVLIIGDKKDQLCIVDQPLVGVPILNYNGGSAQDGVWFFPLGEKGIPDERELLLILPVTGPLIIDLMGRFSKEDALRCQARWARTRALALAQCLAE